VALRAAVDERVDAAAAAAAGAGGRASGGRWRLRACDGSAVTARTAAALLAPGAVLEARCGPAHATLTLADATFSGCSGLGDRLGAGAAEPVLAERWSREKAAGGGDDAPTMAPAELDEALARLRAPDVLIHTSTAALLGRLGKAYRRAHRARETVAAALALAAASTTTTATAPKSERTLAATPYATLADSEATLPAPAAVLVASHLAMRCTLVGGDAESAHPFVARLGRLQATRGALAKRRAALDEPADADGDGRARPTVRYA
jgi:hypothetical protein